MKNYYQILEVSSDATLDQIRKSYRKLALIYHPDKNKSLTAKDKFIEINLAYNTLSDLNLRREYDNILSKKYNENEFENYKSEYYEQREKEFRKKAEQFASEKFENFGQRLKKVKKVGNKIQAGCGCLLFILMFLIYFAMFTTDWNSNLKPIIMMSVIIFGIYIIFKLLKD